MDSARTPSERERAVLQGIAEDKTYPEIAEQLGVSHNTVKKYVTRLFKKLGIRTKVGLALYWARNKEKRPC